LIKRCVLKVIIIVFFRLNR